MLPFSVLTVDPSLGRIEKSALSQQTLMELLIGGFLSSETIIPRPDGVSNIDTWRGLTFGSSRQIFRINFNQKRLRGTLELQWLPTTIESACFSQNYLTGSLDLTCLPDGLEYLDVCANQFDGSVDLTQLPQGMKGLFLNMNDLSGAADFSRLPESLFSLNVRDTKLEGSVEYSENREVLAFGSKVVIHGK